MTTLANARLNPWLSSIFNSKKEVQPELLDIDVTIKENGNITTVVAVAQFKNTPKKEDIRFHENFVKIGYNTFPILEDFDVSVVGNIGGISVLSIDKGKEYITRNGQKLYIKQDFQGNKVLQS